MDITTVDQPGTSGSIVVGVDPSPNAQRALAIAIETARRLGVGCHIVHAWAIPVIAMGGEYAPPVTMDLGPEEHEWLAKLVADTDAQDVEVTSCVVQGNAGSNLVDIARRLDSPFLFVGSVGHGAIVAALLGSVSEYCVHHATCPVVVVPPADRTPPVRTMEDTVKAGA